MDNDSQETLRRVAQNDHSMTELNLADNNYGVAEGKLYSNNSDDILHSEQQLQIILMWQNWRLHYLLGFHWA